MDWADTRAFAGDDAVIEAAVGHLAAKRNGDADPSESRGRLGAADRGRRSFDRQVGPWATDPQATDKQIMSMGKACLTTAKEFDASRFFCYQANTEC